MADELLITVHEAKMTGPAAKDDVLVVSLGLASEERRTSVGQVLEPGSHYQWGQSFSFYGVPVEAELEISVWCGQGSTLLGTAHVPGTSAPLLVTPEGAWVELTLDEAPRGYLRVQLRPPPMIQPQLAPEELSPPQRASPTGIPPPLLPVNGTLAPPVQLQSPDSPATPGTGGLSGRKPRRRDRPLSPGDVISLTPPQFDLKINPVLVKSDSSFLSGKGTPATLKAPAQPAASQEAAEPGRCCIQ
eukprot:RCo011830